ncbi:MAG: DUF3466 family protein, partial [candidate division Zixibacteria bacterium]|nr:DUF3466 family protein [candidate division Zixibacteria bacterium]
MRIIMLRICFKSQIYSKQMFSREFAMHYLRIKPVAAFLSAIFLILSFFNPAAFAEPPQYHLTTITDDGMELGPVYPRHKIANDGTIMIPRSQLANDSVDTYLWRNSEFIPIYPMEDVEFYTTWDMNNNGQITGIHAIDSYHRHAFVSEDSFIVSDLAPLPGSHWDEGQCDNSTGFAINDLGHVAGESRPQDFNTRRATLWTESGPVSLGLVPDLDSTVYGVSSIAYGMNNNGEVVGTSSGVDQDGYIVTWGFCWSGGSMTSIPPFPGGLNSLARDVNDNGQVVGYASGEFDGQVVDHAFLWENGSRIDIHGDGSVYPISGGSEAFAINNQGQAVGAFKSITNAPVQGLLYHEGETYNLNDLIVSDDGSGNSIDIADDINDNGVIVGRSGNSLVVLTPVLDGFVVNSVDDDIDDDPGDGVCSTGDTLPNGDPECTFRAAIQESNALQTRDNIYFNILPKEPPVIMPDSLLPPVADSVEIDASTQPGGKVEVDGSNLTDGDGLVINFDKCVVKHMHINSFPGSGMVVTSDSNQLFSNELKNNEYGITITGSGNQFGSAEPDDANTIMNNDSAGVFVQGGTGNLIRRNIIHDNSGLGIDIVPLGVNPNDTLDTDAGPNGLQNFPVIDSVLASAGSSTVYARLKSIPNHSFIVEVFFNEGCDSTGYGEGQESTWTTVVGTDADGLAEFETTFSGVPDSNQTVTLTATDLDNNTSEFSPCWPQKSIEIVDVNENPIIFTEFLLYRVENDRPDYTEHFIDTIKTDIDGIVGLNEYLFAGDLRLGDTIKVFVLLDTLAAVKDSFEYRYSERIELDNMKFDSVTYDPVFEELDDEVVQTVVMDHTTFGINLTVSIEWEADDVYLDRTEDGFRSMANFLYDVTDGQVRVDTIVIADGKRGWNYADIHVHASNIIWPVAHVGGFYMESNDYMVQFPRRWFGNKDAGRNMSVSEYPHDPSASKQYRTMGHELGHYYLGLYDEYEFAFGGDRCSKTHAYGFMDSHYEVSGPIGSEMSTMNQYQ